VRWAGDEYKPRRSEEWLTSVCQDALAGFCQKQSAGCSITALIMAGFALSFIVWTPSWKIEYLTVVQCDPVLGHY